MDKNSIIYVAGHRGVLGTAVCHLLRNRGYGQIITRTHGELDLEDKHGVDSFFARERPEYVFFFAARRTSILDKVSRPLDACLANIKMAVNVLEAAHNNGVKRLLFSSSSLAYPMGMEAPLRDDAILSGPYEKSNEPYSLGKIIGSKLCEYYHRQYADDYFSVMPCGFFGPGDDFEIGRGPVIPTMIHRMQLAKERGDREFVIWGTGSTRREYLFSTDVAEGCLFLMQHAAGGANYNLGNGGRMVSILELARTIAKVIKYEGALVTDTTKPDGAKMLPLDSSRIMQLGWQPRCPLEQGIEESYRYFMAHRRNGKEDNYHHI